MAAVLFRFSHRSSAAILLPDGARARSWSAWGGEERVKPRKNERWSHTDRSHQNVLHLLEVRQDVLVAPALVAESLPVVVVVRVAPVVDHVVEHARPAHHLERRKKRIKDQVELGTPADDVLTNVHVGP